MECGLSFSPSAPDTRVPIRVPACLPQVHPPRQPAIPLRCIHMHRIRMLAGTGFCCRTWFSELEIQYILQITHLLTAGASPISSPCSDLVVVLILCKLSYPISSMDMCKRISQSAYKLYYEK